MSSHANPWGTCTSSAPLPGYFPADASAGRAHQAPHSLDYPDSSSPFQHHARKLASRSLHGPPQGYYQAFALRLPLSLQPGLSRVQTVWTTQESGSTGPETCLSSGPSRVVRLFSATMSVIPLRPACLRPPILLRRRGCCPAAGGTERCPRLPPASCNRRTPSFSKLVEI